MKAEVRRVYQDFAQMCNVPMLIYIYETGRIEAYNRRLEDIVTDIPLTIHQFMGRIVRFKPEQLDNGSFIEYEIKIKCGNIQKSMDCEYNIISLKTEHIVVCVMEESYKDFFNALFNPIAPRIYWNLKNDENKISYKTYGNKFFTQNTFYDEKERNTNFFKALDSADIMKFDEINNRIANNRMGEFDIIKMVTLGNEKIFGRYHKIPVIDAKGEVRGILSMLYRAMNSNDYEKILSKAMEEKYILSQLVQKSDTIFCSWYLGKDMRIRYVSPNVLKLGYKAREIYSDEISIYSIVYKDDLDDLLKSKNVFINPEFLNQEFSMQLRLQKKNGTLVWAHMDIVAHKDYRGDTVLDAMITLLNRRKNSINKEGLLETSRKLKDSFTAIETVFDNIGSLVFVIYESDHTIIRVNKRVKAIYDPEDMNNLVGVDLLGFFEKRNIVLYRMDSIYNQSENSINDMPKGYCYDEINDIYYMYETKRSLMYSEEKIVVVTLTDISSIVGKEEKLISRPFIDLLTGIPNRLGFEREIKQIQRNSFYSNSENELIVIDIDDFDSFNSKYGYKTGDKLLWMIAKELICNPNMSESTFRIGGDEFAIIADNSDSKDEIVRYIQDLFLKDWVVYDQKCKISVSMGITKFYDDSVSENNVLKNAQAALKTAKEKGRNSVVNYKPSGKVKKIDIRDINKQLINAVTGGYAQFKILYQPIVDASTKRIIGAEALLRWFSPEYGYINPVEFIPASEYLGLIVPLGEYVCQNAFAMCKKINNKEDDNFCVHINLSVVQLVQENFVEKLSELVRVMDLNSSNVIFEVTQGLSLDDADFMKKILDDIKREGFKIALDDFGTGNLSFDNIMSMPFDFVKIGKQLIERVDKGEVTPQVIKGMVELANSFNLNVIVEGIENEKQIEQMEQYKVYAYQGYYFGRPVDTDEFEDILKQRE